MGKKANKDLRSPIDVPEPLPGGNRMNIPFPWRAFYIWHGAHRMQWLLLPTVVPVWLPLCLRCPSSLVLGSPTCWKNHCRLTPSRQDDARLVQNLPSPPQNGIEPMFGQTVHKCFAVVTLSIWMEDPLNLYWKVFIKLSHFCTTILLICLGWYT